MKNNLKLFGSSILTILLVFSVGCGTKEHVHDISSEWVTTEEEHYHTCSGCEELLDKGTHTYDSGVITTPASYTAEGVKTFTCTTCGHTKTESVPMLVATKLDNPVIELSENGIHVTVPTNATGVRVWLNDGDPVEGNEYSKTWSTFTEVGNYLVKAQAYSTEDAYTDSDVVNDNFTVKNCELILSRTTVSSVSWTYEGVKTQIQHNKGEWVDTEETTYTATSSEVVSVKSIGGYVNESKTYYINDVEKSASLLCNATNDLVIYSVGDKVAGDVADDWKVYKYADGSGWTTTGATIGVGTSYDGKTSVCKLNCWNNYTTFKYSIGYNASDLYNTLSFVCKGDGVAKIRIRLTNSKTGVYMTYNAGTVANKWYEVDLSMNDSNWKIAFNGGEYPFDTVKEQAGLLDSSELISMFDTFEVITYGETANGANTTLYIGEIKARNVENSVTKMEEKESSALLVIDFEDGSVGNPYVNASWECKKYTDNWVDGGQMNCRSKGGSKVVNFVTGYYTSYRYTYTIGKTLSSVSSFSLRLWNDFSGGTTIKVKFALIDNNGNSHYAAGTADTWEEIAFGTADTLFTANMNCSNIVAVRVVANGPSNNSQYLYVDDITIK